MTSASKPFDPVGHVYHGDVFLDRGRLGREAGDRLVDAKLRYAELGRVSANYFLDRESAVETKKIRSDRWSIMSTSLVLTGIFIVISVTLARSLKSVATECKERNTHTQNSNSLLT